MEDSQHEGLINHIALALKDERPGTNWDANKKVQWDLDVKAIANACGGLFKRERFIEVAGGLFWPK